MQVFAPWIQAYHEFFPYFLSSCPRQFYFHILSIPFAACNLIYPFQPLAYPPFCSVIASQFEYLCPVSPKFSSIFLHAPQCSFKYNGWPKSDSWSLWIQAASSPVLNRSLPSFSLLVYGSNSCVSVHLMWNLWGSRLLDSKDAPTPPPPPPVDYPRW